MALTNAFYTAVKEGKVRLVRIMMKDSLLFDPTFQLYKDMEKAASSMAGLYDIHDGRDLIMDSAEWNDDYMSLLMVQVIDNFSHERLDHLKDVVRHLRPAPDKTIKVPTGASNYDPVPKSSYKAEKERCQKNGDYLGTKLVVGTGIGAAVGCGIGYTIASATELSVVGAVTGGLVAGAVIGGAAAMLLCKGGE